MNTGSHYARMADTIAFLVNEAGDQPDLAALAQQAGMSEFHFHRLFSEWVGLTPKEFLQFITIGHAKELLRESNSLLQTAFQVGLSGTSRLHDLFLTVESMTPGEYKLRGHEMTVRWAVADTVLGSACFAATEKGLCRLIFDEEGSEPLRGEWPRSRLIEDPAFVRPYVEEVNLRLQGSAPRARLGLLLKGSDLRLHVWRALLEIAPGQITSYGALAQFSGFTGADRAVATAVAQNPVAVLIPCHRVILASGVIGQYRGGAARKNVLLANEWSRTGGKTLETVKS